MVDETGATSAATQLVTSGLLRGGKSNAQVTRELLVFEQYLKTLQPKTELVIAGHKIPVETLQKVVANYNQLSGQAGQISLTNDEKVRLAVLKQYERANEINLDLAASQQKTVQGWANFLALGEFVCHLAGYEEGEQFCKNGLAYWESKRGVKPVLDGFEGLLGQMTPDLAASLGLAQQGGAAALAIANKEAPRLVAGVMRAVDGSLPAVAAQIPSLPDDAPQGSLATARPQGAASTASPAAPAKRDAAAWFQQNMSSLGITEPQATQIARAYKTYAGQDGVLQTGEELNAFKGSKPVQELTAEKRDALLQKLMGDKLVAKAPATPEPA